MARNHRNMTDKPTKHRAEPAETVRPAGRCPSCRSWLYYRDGSTHVCVSTNDGEFIPQRGSGVGRGLKA